MPDVDRFKAAEVEQLADPGRLTRWLDDHIPSSGEGPLKARFLHGGTSNVIISLERGSWKAVLRRPPVVPPPNSEKTVMREARVLTALNDTAVPHPFCHAICSNASVIGAPFYVMEQVEGWAAELRDGQVFHRPPFDRPPLESEVTFALVDGLIALAKIDYKVIGLESFGRPEGFLERQVERWDSQLKSYSKLYNYSGRELPGYEKLIQWLRSNIPSDFKAGIMHGDVGTPNALFAEAPPARLVALIDWELSTIGDPLIDLAWFVSGLRDERDLSRTPPKAVYNAANLPTRQELLRHYSEGTRRDVSNFNYYLLLALFKGGCILEYKVAQAAAGILPKEIGAFFDRLVLAKFSEADWLRRQLD